MSSLSSKLKFSNLNVPQTTKVLLIGLTVGSVLLQLFKLSAYNSLVNSGEKNVNINYIIVPFLQLVPNHTLFNPWTVVTAVFVDAQLWRYALSVIVTFFAGKFIERSWSGKELLHFVILIGGISNLLTSLTLIFWNILFGIDFYDIPVDGNLALLISFLVVFKQLIPEHSLSIFNGAIHARVKHIPFVTLLVLTITSVITMSATPAIQSWLGFIVSWTYLRFFQSNVVDPILPQPNDVVGVRRLKGDASETFSLAHFFPDSFAPILNPIFNQVFELLVQVNLLNRFNESDIEQGNLIANRRLTGQQRTEQSDSRNAAERRRQVALKVLEERIGDDSTKRTDEQPKPEQDSVE